MVTNGGVAAISKRARTPVTNPSHIIRIPAKNSRFNSIIESEPLRIKMKTTKEKGKKESVKRKLEIENLLGHKTAMIVPNNLPYNFIVLHL